MNFIGQTDLEATYEVLVLEMSYAYNKRTRDDTWVRRLSISMTILEWEHRNEPPCVELTAANAEIERCAKCGHGSIIDGTKDCAYGPNYPECEKQWRIDCGSISTDEMLVFRFNWPLVGWACIAVGFWALVFWWLS